MNSSLFVKPGTGNKYHQQLVFKNTDLAEYALPTYPVDSRADVERLVRDGQLSLPLIIKPDNGSQATRVRVIRDLSELGKIDSFREMVAQAYIEFDYEWRVYVIGGTVMSAGRSANRIGDSDRPGFTDRLLETDDEVVTRLREISACAASLLGLEYSGVDIMRDKVTGKYHIIEANVLAAIAMPHYSKNTGENLPKEIIDWFCERDKLVNQRLPLEQCLEDYLAPRLRRLTQSTQDAVKAILEKNARPETETSEQELANSYFDFNLEDKLAFIYSELASGRRPGILDVVLSESENSVSWAGNFLVAAKPVNKNFVEPSAKHTLENGACASAYYIAIKSML
jgi:hypothetical protein